jgi:hypothetical protein
MPLVHEGGLVAVVSLYGSTPNAFTDDHARLLTLLAPSLAMSIASLPKHDTWTQDTRRQAGGELRLFKRS